MAKLRRGQLSLARYGCLDGNPGIFKQVAGQKVQTSLKLSCCGI